MIGGLRFALARARAALPPLVTLGAVSALAALLILGLVSATSTFDTRELRESLASAPADRALTRVVVDGSVAEAAAAARGALDAAGVGDVVSVAERDGDVVVEPVPSVIRASDLTPLIAVLADVDDSVEDAVEGSAQVSGELRSILESIRDTIGVRAGPNAISFALLALMVAVVVAATARETVGVRVREIRLLRARGVRRGALVRLTLLETVPIAVVGAAMGALLVAAAPVTGAAAPSPVALVAAVAVVAIVAGVSAAAAMFRSAAEHGRGRVAGDATTLVLLSALAGIAIWQFVRSGGDPVLARADGAVLLDPLVTIAPALVLVLSALAAVAVATPVARAGVSLLRSTRGAVPVTPLRLALRRPGRHALPITAMAFAVGSIVVAAVYASSLAALGDTPEAVRVGADVRAVSVPADIDPTAVAEAGSPDAFMLVRPTSARGADARIPVIAVDSARVGEVMLDAGGVIDPGALASAITPAVDVPALAGDTLTFTVMAESPPPFIEDGVEYPQSAPAVQGWVTLTSISGLTERLEFSNADVMTSDDQGNVAVEVDVRPRENVSLALPPGDEWMLLAVDVALLGFTQGAVNVTDAAIGGSAIDLGAFGPAAETPGSVSQTAGGLQITPEATFTDERVYTRVLAPGVPTRLPVVVTAAVAQSMSLASGEEFSIDLTTPERAVDLRVSAIAPVLPGSPTGEGILVDRVSLALATGSDLPANQVWLRTADAGASAAGIAGTFPAVVVQVADDRSAMRAATSAVVLSGAAAGAALLAAVVLILRRSRGRGDARESAMLAVLGLGRRGAAIVRASEDVFAIVLGAVGGLAAGGVTAVVVVPSFARAAYGDVPDTLPVALTASPTVLIGTVGAFLVVSCLIAATSRAPGDLAASVREDE